MRSRIATLLLLVYYQMGEPLVLFQTFVNALVICQDTSQEWKSIDPKLDDIECSLLEYACGTGDMRNHQPLFAHCDTNKSHPLKSMMVFGKLAPKNEINSNLAIESMQPATLLQPHQALVWKIRCGRDVLHCRFAKTFHLSDATRGFSNWSWVHGP